MYSGMKTLGGRQFWGDVHFFRDWRIQKRVQSERFRLLDGKDRRFASGTFEQCLMELERQKKIRRLEPYRGKAVVLLHGIMRSAKSFNPFRRELEKKGYHVYSVDYPSTRVSIEQAADYLHQVLQSLEGIDQLSLIGHSMGGLVIRAWFQEHEDARIDKVIMLGTPNQGAEMAEALKNFLPFQWVLGEAGQQLATNEMNSARHLAVPSVPFGIIAGGRGEQTNGYNPWLPGDDDGTVTVASAHLEGEADFLRLPCLHMFLMRDKWVIKAALQFLETGKFSPNPVPVETG